MKKFIKKMLHEHWGRGNGGMASTEDPLGMELDGLAHQEMSPREYQIALNRIEDKYMSRYAEYEGDSYGIIDAIKRFIPNKLAALYDDMHPHVNMNESDEPESIDSVDISLLMSLVDEYPDLVNFYKTSLPSLRFKINENEELVYGEHSFILPSYMIEYSEIFDRTGFKGWSVNKHDYTPNGRDRDKTTHKFGPDETDKVYKLMKRIINNLIRKSNTSQVSNETLNMNESEEELKFNTDGRFNKSGANTIYMGENPIVDFGVGGIGDLTINGETIPNALYLKGGYNASEQGKGYGSEGLKFIFQKLPKIQNIVLQCFDTACPFWVKMGGQEVATKEMESGHVLRTLRISRDSFE